MLLHIEKTEELRVLARVRQRQFETRTVDKAAVQSELAAGWHVKRENKNTVQLMKDKEARVQLRDRVWSLFFRLGFTHLSTDVDPVVNLSESAAFEFDVAGVDDEIGLAVRCIAADEHQRFRGADKEFSALASIQDVFSDSVAKQFLRPLRRQVATAVFFKNIHLSTRDRRLAADYNVLVFDEGDLAYYEGLASHLGAAAKYQMLADMFPGKQIPGLSAKVPAVRSKMGTFFCYTFSVSPEYLLKVGYVSHRARGKKSDMTTYQRMVAKSRLKQIREYISDDGIFPTNIVVSLDSAAIVFDPHSSDRQVQTDLDSGISGMLTIHGTFKCAWIIDGQHRLFAYSGHPMAHESRLSVLAFEGLPLSTQAKLFIDINAKQKSVKLNLLQELYADLKWNADDPKDRIGAIISKAIQELGKDPESPLHGRIQTVDEERSDIRCISLPSMFKELERGGFYIGSERQGRVAEFGPLGSTDNDLSLDRTVLALNHWFGLVSGAVPDWWALGAAPGGGLAMNDGVSSLLGVLRSVYQHLESSGVHLARIEDQELLDCAEPFGRALGEYLAGLSETDRKNFRGLRGNEGLSKRVRKLQQAIRDRIPEYNPTGLDDFLKQEAEQTNSRAKEIIDRLEVGLQQLVLKQLRQHLGPEESEWWINGVPKNVRIKATQRQEEDDAKRGGKEYYLDLIDYRTIAQSNWQIFGDILGYGSGNKDKRTSWINTLNDKRRVVAHASSGKTLSIEELEELQRYDEWFNRIAADLERVPSENSE